MTANLTTASAACMTEAVTESTGGCENANHSIDGPTTSYTSPKHAKAIRTLVAMPAYNEEAHIARIIVGASQHADAVLVVDDGSKDDTISIATALGAIVVRHETNNGYGGALQTISPPPESRSGRAGDNRL